MSTIYFIRHGKPAFPSNKKYCIGMSDVPLSDEGREQMAALKRFVCDADIRRIYTSPLSRSAESGQILSGGHIPVETREDLSEINMGIWENKTFDDIRVHYPIEYAQRKSNFARFRIPGGETFEECQQRAFAAYRDILSRTGDENIAIVGHSGFIRALVCLLEGRDLSEVMDIPMPYAGVYAWDIGPNIGAVITAAGLSARMGSLKPVLKLEDGNFLTHEIKLLSRAGVRRTVIVTGREAQLIRAAAAGPGISFAHNPYFASTKMFDSACIGMRALPASLEGTLFLPVDAPVFSLFTVKQLQQVFDRSSASVFRPVYKNEPGHPLLLRRSFLPKIYEHTGPCGLRGVLNNARDHVMDIPVPDPGILMDADFPEEYEALLTYERTACVPSREACLELLTWKKLPTVVVAHSLAVADRAVSMAKAFNRAGGNLSIELIEAAALLHDIAKGTPDHGRTGALWLRQMGFPQVATAMEHHTHLPGSMQHILDEAAVVFLADKLFINDRPCTIEERYALRALEYPDAAALITEKAGQAKEILSLLEKHIHIKG